MKLTADHHALFEQSDSQKNIWHHKIIKTLGLLRVYEILERLPSGADQINRQLPGDKQIQMMKLHETEFEKTAICKIKYTTLISERREV